MSKYIETIYVQPGIRKQINYEALANKPQSDITLAVPGGFADAHAVGARIQSLLNNISQNSTSIQNLIDTDIAALKSQDQKILSDLVKINEEISAINEKLTTITSRVVELEKLPARITTLEKLPARIIELEKLPTRIAALEALPAKVAKLEELPARIVTLEKLPEKITQLESNLGATNTNYNNLIKELQALKEEVQALKQPQPSV